MIYITGSELSTRNAHSNQISAMTKTYKKILKDDFLFFSVTRDKNKKDNDYNNYIFSKTNNRFTKYLKLCLTVSIRYRKKIKMHQTVITRDIFVAYYFKKLGFNVAYEVHNQFHTKAGRFLIRRLRNKILYIFSCKGLQDYFIERYNVPKNHSLVAHNGVFIENYSPLSQDKITAIKKKYDLPLNKTILLHSGSLYKGRGIELLKPIMDKFNKMYCVCVGGQPKDIEYWEEYYKEYPSIKFLGHFNSEMLIDVQRISDINFLPVTKNNKIWWATSPLKLFEYLASPGYLLASNVGSINEIISEDSAVIFDPYDEVDLVQKVEQILEGKVSENILKNQKILAEKYTWFNRAKNILHFVNSFTRNS